MRPLSDTEICERFGALFEEAHRAFLADPEYVVRLAEAAARVRAARVARPAKPEPKPKEKRQEPHPFEAELVRRRREGASLAVVAAEFNVSVSTATRISRSAGILRRRPNQVMSPQARQIRNHRIRAALDVGISVGQIAAQTGLSRTAVRSIAADTSAVSIRTVLHHRASVKRSTTQHVNGQPVTTWTTVATEVPCLLDVATTGQPEPTYTAQQQQTLDRAGVLFTLPAADLRPGDRVSLTRGQSGTFVVKPDPSRVSTLTGISHHEHRVEEVP